MEHELRKVGTSLLLVAAVAASLVAAPGPDGALGAFLGALMLAIAVTDARRYLIPNELTGAAAALALFRAAAIGPDADATALLWAVGRALVIALPLLGLMAGYRALRGRDGLGLGDVKLAAVAGAWLGLPALFAAIEVAALAAIGAYVLNAAIKRRPLTSTAFLPFGTFLAPAIWLGWLAEALLN
jgi:leader peptidase (prepilin peptidase)/N-methyltransferase